MTSVESVAFGGALTSRWHPPISCLSTTSRISVTFGWDFFLGYHPSLGIDRDCFPPMPHTITTTSTTSSTPVLVTFEATVRTTTSGSVEVVYPTIISTITYMPYEYTQRRFVDVDQNTAYFSPGICPSGYEYAASFTGALNIPGHSTQISPLTESESRYLCCPSGYTVQLTTSLHMNWRTTSTKSYDYDYPLCSRTAPAFSNVVEIGRKWPTVKSPEPVPSEVNATGYKTKLTAIASGIIVGWKSSDAIVTDFIQNNQISLPNRSKTTPPTSSKTSLSSHGNETELSGPAIGSIVTCVIVAAIIVISLFYISHKEKRKAKEMNTASAACLEHDPSEHTPTNPFIENSSANSVRSAGLTPSSRLTSTTNIEMRVDPRMAAPRRALLDEDESLEPPPPRYEEAIREPNARLLC